MYSGEGNHSLGAPVVNAADGKRADAIGTRALLFAGPSKDRPDQHWGDLFDRTSRRTPLPLLPLAWNCGWKGDFHDNPGRILMVVRCDSQVRDGWDGGRALGSYVAGGRPGLLCGYLIWGLLWGLAPCPSDSASQAVFAVWTSSGLALPPLRLRTALASALLFSLISPFRQRLDLAQMVTFLTSLLRVPTKPLYLQTLCS